MMDNEENKPKASPRESSNLNKNPDFAKLQNAVVGGQDQQGKAGFGYSDTAARTGEEFLYLLYRSNWMANKFVEIVPDEMTNAGYHIRSSLMTPLEIEAFQREVQETGLTSTIKAALMQARIDDHSYIIIGTSSGSWSKPLTKFGKGDLRNLIVSGTQNMNASQYTEDLMDPNYGNPFMYTYADTFGNMVEVHWTRVVSITFIGLEDIRHRDQYATPLDNFMTTANDFSDVKNSIQYLIKEANLDIIFVKDLIRMLRSKDTKDKDIIKKLQEANINNKSILKSIYLDADYKYERKGADFTTLDDLFDRFQNIVSSAADIPNTRFFGFPPKGLNATGVHDENNYLRKVQGLQNNIYRPILTKLLPLMYQTLLGKEMPQFWVEFNSLEIASTEEKAKSKLNNAKADETNLDMGAISSGEVRQELIQNNVYDNLGRTEETVDLPIPEAKGLKGRGKSGVTASVVPKDKPVLTDPGQQPAEPATQESAPPQGADEEPDDNTPKKRPNK